VSELALGPGYGSRSVNVVPLTVATSVKKNPKPVSH
jgi:hypothetical protein